MYMLITPQGPGLLPRRCNGEHRTHGRGSGGNRYFRAADDVRSFDVEPRVAMLSFSNFGSHAPSAGGQGAPRREHRPAAAPDADDRRRDAGRHRGSPEILESTYPVQHVEGRSQCADLPQPRIRQHRLQAADRASAAREAIGPILMGLSKPVHVLQRGAEVNDIVHVAALAVVEAQAHAQTEPAPGSPTVSGTLERSRQKTEARAPPLRAQADLFPRQVTRIR